MSMQNIEYTAPVKVGDKISTVVQNLGEKGDGIARYDNFTVIIPKARIGEEITVKIKKVFEKYCFAERI